MTLLYQAIGAVVGAAAVVGLVAGAGWIIWKAGRGK